MGSSSSAKAGLLQKKLVPVTHPIENIVKSLLIVGLIFISIYQREQAGKII